MLPQKFVDDGKRERCADAIAELAHELGADGVSMARVITRAQIGRATFYELFGGVDQGLQFACKLGDELMAEAIEGALRGDYTREERVDRAIEAFLAAVHDQPRLAELCLVHRAGILGVPVDLEEEATGAALLAALEQERPEHEARREQLAVVEELIVGGILSVVALRLQSGKLGSLKKLHGELVTLALGATEAAVAI